MIKVQEIEAIIQHRRMWNKIAELIHNGMECTTIVPYKEKALEELGLKISEFPRNMCWCCEATECDNCLVIWENNPESKCTSETGEYWKFILALRWKNWERAEELATTIANLPERFK